MNKADADLVRHASANKQSTTTKVQSTNVLAIKKCICLYSLCTLVKAPQDCQLSPLAISD